ncbi:MAG TPA: PilZ domain-containing protein [Devosia sp.]|nr:PilZ domain-containing protein [Devosia sp.]
MANLTGAPNRVTPRSEARFIGDVAGNFVFSGREAEDERLRVHACRARSISTSLAVVTTDAEGEVGEAVVLRFDIVGIRRGTIERKLPGGFVIKIAPEHSADVVEARIDWLRKNSTGRAENRRIHKRVLPRGPLAKVILDEKRQIACRVVDMSQTGVGVTCKVQLPIGTLAAVGAVPGKIVRHFDGGFGLEFTEKQDLALLEELLTLATPEAKAIAAKALGFTVPE